MQHCNVEIDDFVQGHINSPKVAHTHKAQTFEDIFDLEVAKQNVVVVELLEIEGELKVKFPYFHFEECR